MPTTYKAGKAAADVLPREHLGVISVTSTFELTAALALNDVIEMAKVPAGATVLETTLAVDDLDTGTAPAIVLAVGDGADDDRFVTGSTIGQAGGFARMNNIDGLGHKYAAEDTIDVKVTTAPATGTGTGTVTLVVLYSMNP